MAQTADILTIRYGTPGNSTQPTNLPMGAGALTVYRGTIALTDSNGYIKNASSPSVNDTCWGIIGQGGPGYVDSGPGIVNAAGAASSAVTVDVETGSFWLAAGSGADALTEVQVGKNVYVINETTVGATSASSTRPVAGVLIRASDPLNVLSGLVAVKLGSSQSSGGPS